MEDYDKFIAFNRKLREGDEHSLLATFKCPDGFWLIVLTGPENACRRSGSLERWDTVEISAPLNSKNPYLDPYFSFEDVGLRKHYYYANIYRVIDTLDDHRYEWDIKFAPTNAACRGPRRVRLDG